MLSLTSLAALVVVGLGLALFLALYLFCTLKVEIRAAGRQTGTAAPCETRETGGRLDQTATRSRAQAPPEIEPAAPAEPSAVPVRPGMNLNRRSQALRLARRGESPEQIASRLGLPTGEVRLLLKIHGKLMQQALAGPGDSGRLKSDGESADILSSATEGSARAVQSR